MAPQNSAVYVYCVVQASRRPPAARVPQGLPGATHPEPSLVDDGLFLVTSEVPLDVYGPPQLEPRLRNLDWVAETAVAHEAVVEHFARRRGAVVVPMKMFTMFSSIEKARADVRGRRQAVDRAMRRIAGCEEWGIRVTRDPAALTRASKRRPPRSKSAPASGAAFLAARKAARDAERDSRGASRATANAAFERLRRLARAAQRRDQQPQPGTNPPILEAAFLVPSARRDRFKAEARRQAAVCAAAGAAMVLTGPWPAYNFVNGGERS
jgi:hypothetical protein